MSLIDSLLTRGLIPDKLIRHGIRRLLRERLAADCSGSALEKRERLIRFAQELESMPVALETAAANEQHYEVPAAFYQAVLGPRLKYSCGLYEPNTVTLAAAEEAMLALTCSRADLHDGQEVLELGCGWGSLTLWMAEKYPALRITAVSNSSTQREHIEKQAAARGFSDRVRVITCDMNVFAAEPGRYDRVVSVEMFEHMKNYRELMRRISTWLKPDGRLFVHIFTHKDSSYHFVARDESDWMSRYFFTGGTMPAKHLLEQFGQDLDLEQLWEVSGTHYARTSEDWLLNMDAARAQLTPLFQKTYGPDARKMWHYWRVFFMSCAELWAYDSGREWPVCHYRFKRVSK